MPTTRKPTRRPPRGPHITPEAIELFRRVCEIEDSSDDIGEDDGKRRTWLDARLALHVALGLQPWDCDVLDTDDGPPPAAVASAGAWRVENWRRAAAIRRELERPLAASES